MAKAPAPGAGKRAKAADAAQKVAEITIRGETRRLSFNLDFKTRAIVRKATGMPIEAYMGGELLIGEDSLQVMWWLAGRATDPFLTLDKVIETWPAGLQPDEIEVVVDDGEDDDPEA